MKQTQVRAGMALRAGLMGLLMMASGLSMAAAAQVPELVNYQGVLRDAAGSPLTGSYNMVLALFDASTAGNEILVDSHTSGGGSAVVVSNGLFSVQIGAGTVSDGSGPGTWTSLSDVFAGHGGVWLEVRVGSETLSPRTRIVSSASALNADRIDGKDSTQLLDTSSDPQTKTGTLTLGDPFVPGTGLSIFGNNGGGPGPPLAVLDNGNGTWASLVTGTNAIVAHDNVEAGVFHNGYNSTAHLATGFAGLFGAGFNGVEGYGFGGGAGGAFFDGATSSTAYLASGDKGVIGNSFVSSGSGGHFYGEWGVTGEGRREGGRFIDVDTGSEARLGSDIYGVIGNSFATGGAGGQFYGLAYGITGYSPLWGGYFRSDSGGYSYVGFGDTGVSGGGPYAGGYFVDGNNYGSAFVGHDIYKIYGNGQVSFVQNHPQDSSKVIVYAAPEGPEAATYTRGTARLVSGEARVKLDPTFAMVTNPDIGLTAHLTPRGKTAVAYAQSLSTSELVIRSDDPTADGALIDYLVYGLRIGFEQAAIVKDKEMEAYIPSMASQREILTSQPELTQYTALERFKAMRAEIGETAPLDLTAAAALHDAIGEFDPATMKLPEPLLPAGAGEPPSHSPERLSPPYESGPPLPPASPLQQSRPLQDESLERRAGRPAGFGATAGLVEVSEQVEAGQVLVASTDGSRLAHLGDTAADRGALGIVAGEPGQTYTGRAPVATMGSIIIVKVDAAYGPIARGDFLTVSPTLGAAMRSADGAAGTIVGKALESLGAGTGTIQVLVMSR